MCMASVIYDYARTIKPSIWVQDPTSLQLLKDILKKVEELDAKTGQPDCEDPAKSKWMRDVEKRLKKLETA